MSEVSKIKYKEIAVVTHPLLQHSHQMAWALNSRGILKEYRSGIPTLSPDSRKRNLIQRFLPKIKTTDISKIRVKWNPLWPVLMMVARSIGDEGVRHDNIHRVLHAFDWYTSKVILKSRPKLVIAYENSAYHTFIAAKSIGAICILEAPSLHHQKARHLINVKSKGYIAEINRKKDVEVELADHVITCSPIARNSYIEYGVPQEKVKSILLGANLPEIKRPSREMGVPRFIFAGTMSERKSIDILLAVFSEINSINIRAELYIYGGYESLSLLSKAKQTAGVIYSPQVSQTELYFRMASCDCLVLASRFDSFGMVVAESMAVGTPVIVSTMTGSRAIVEDFPGSGWIVEPTKLHISAIIEDLIKNPSKLVDASLCALTAAKKYTWNSYRSRVADSIEIMLEGNQ